MTTIYVRLTPKFAARSRTCQIFGPSICFLSARVSLSLLFPDIHLWFALPSPSVMPDKVQPLHEEVASFTPDPISQDNLARPLHPHQLTSPIPRRTPCPPAFRPRIYSTSFAFGPLHRPKAQPYPMQCIRLDSQRPPPLAMPHQSPQCLSNNLILDSNFTRSDVQSLSLYFSFFYYSYLTSYGYTILTYFSSRLFI